MQPEIKIVAEFAMALQAAAVSGSAFSVSNVVVKLPALMTPPRLTPSCFSSERCTSATVTLSITCSSASTVSMLMTVSVSDFSNLSIVAPSALSLLVISY